MNRRSWIPTAAWAICATLLFGSTVPAAAGGELPQSVAEALQAAQSAYEQGGYAEAAESYRSVLAGGWSSADLYYNLGCASYKAGRIGWAVACLEEARRLAPRDAGIRHNLKVAQGQRRDRPAEGTDSPVLGALAGVLDAFVPADAVRGLLALGWAAGLALAAALLTGPRIRTLARRGLVVLAVLAALTLVALAAKAYQVASAPSGVVIAEEAQVLTGPREGETVQFVLHEGTLVHLGRQAGSWHEVWLSESMRGWLPRESVAALRPVRWLP